jgi:hypothetical protein
MAVGANASSAITAVIGNSFMSGLHCLPGSIHRRSAYWCMQAWCNLSAALNGNKLTYSCSVHRPAWSPLVVVKARASDGDFHDL